jgi:Spy/CpxP family protein refolding chaperone
MSRRAYLYFALTFVLGIVVGCAGTIFSGWYFGHPHREFDPKRVERFLKRELKLSDAQTQQLEQIMKDTDEKYKQLHIQVDPLFDAVREESRDRVRKILNPDQLAKFNELARRFDERRKRQRPE